MKVIIKAIKTNKETDKAVLMTFQCFSNSRCSQVWGKKTMWMPKSVFSYVVDSFAAEIVVDSWFFKKQMTTFTDGWGY